MWIAALLVIGAGPALASGEAEEAEVTFKLGMKAYNDQQDYETALANFLASNRLAPNPSVAFNIARCYARLDRFAEAYRWFTIAKEGLSNDSKVDLVKEELTNITPKVVVYDIVSDPPGATVYGERKDLGVIGVTPFKIAMAPLAASNRDPNPSRTFIFEKEGWEDSSTKITRGSRGETVQVAGQLRQVVGTIDVHAPDGTVVHQGAPDGPVVCEAPCEAKLAPGNWVLYFRKDGFRDAVRQLEVVADQTMTTLVELTPNTGSVVIDATERGALIEIDGEAAGFTPSVVQAVAVGERTVRVSRPGYEPIVRTVQVETDKQVTLDDLELLPLNEVTAVSRRAERIELAPSSVTVIGQEELKAFQYPTIYEALRGVRGFSLTYDSAYGGAAVRGLGQANDYNNRLLVLSDGAILNDSILLQSFISYDGRIDLGGIERIEVVRGPGSVLYGTGAVSGVVNLVSDSIDTPEGTDISVGTYDNHVLRARAQAHYNLADGIGFRAAVSGGASQGREELLDPRGPDNDLTVQGFDRFQGATTQGRLWIKDATIQWFHTWRDIHIPTGIYFTDFNPDEHVWTDVRTLVEARYEPQLSEAAKLLTRLYFNRYVYDGVLPYGPSNSVETYTGVSFGAEARIVLEPSDAFRLTVGGQGDNSPTASMVGQDEYNDGTVEPYLDSNTPYSVFAGYALVDLVPVEAFRLTVGGRADYWSTFKNVAFSPRLAVVLVPDDGDYVKILGGRAFRAPSIFELAYSSPFQALPDDLQPETVWSGELEYSHAFDDAWTGLVAGHGSYAENLVTTQTYGDPADGVIQYLNSPDPIRIYGVDGELRRGFQGGWMLSGFYSYLDSRTADGEIVPNAPQHNAGVKLIVPISAPTARVAFRSSLEAPRRIDATRDDSTGLAVISDVVLSGAVPERGFEYAVGVYNLFNMVYAQPVVDNYPERVMPQQGRSLMATLSMRF
ncbi:MAG: TonB-dependent receptor [Myxococcota bacterium]